MGNWKTGKGTARREEQKIREADRKLEKYNVIEERGKKGLKKELS